MIALAPLLPLALPAALAEELAPPVPARLVADTATASPGQLLHAAVVLDVPAGWHIYWQNPGESGLATWVELSGPEGADLGPTRYPGPERFDLPGGIVNYGYGHSTAFVHEVRLPDPLAADTPVELRARVGWLLCREACVPGSAELALTLPLAGSPGAEPADAAAPPASWLAPLPTPFPGTLRATPDGWRLTLPGARLDAWFPLAGAPRVTAERSGALRLHTDEPVEGVVRATDADGPRWYTLSPGARP